MTYLIVLLIVAMVLGPLLWMRPSAGQNRLAQIRLRARALGLDVRLAQLPQTHRDSVRQEPTVTGAAYRLLVHDPRTVVACEHLLVRAEPGGAWEARGETLPAALQACLDRVSARVPADVLAIEIVPQGPALYWRERGGDDAVEQVASALGELRDAMRV